MVNGFLNGHIRQVMEKPEYFEQPYNYGYYHNNIKNFFDFGIHRDVGVDKPKKNTRDN